jgi:hypothetical protein
MADISSDLKNWSTTESSNSPSGGTTLGAGLDDNLRRIQATVRQDLAHKGSDIASTATPDVGAVAGLAHDITGTTTITGLGTVSAGIWKILKFEGALTLTHNATSLILPGGANITTADGDIGIFISEGSGNWRCVSYFRAGAVPYAIATQAEQETGTSTTVAVTPGRQAFHPSAAKCWAFVTVSGGVPTLTSSYNITSITDTATGRLTITVATDFSSANWCCVPGVEVQDTAGAGGNFAGVKIDPTSLAAGSVVLENWNIQFTAGAGDVQLADPTSWSMVGYGDQ